MCARIAAICAALAICLTGCSLGPRSIETQRLRYNEAVKRTTEEQLLLNIIRLRYSESPSSLAVSSIAAQQELVKSLKLVPFFVVGGDPLSRGLTSLLPQGELNAADRPTVSFTPLDDQDFTKRLFTPLPLDGVIYLSKTTWPISTVFRLWLENINWVPNAETASGPTPRLPPIFAEYRNGMEALQRLQDRKLIAFFAEDKDEKISENLPTARIGGVDLLEAAKAGYEFRKDEKKDSWVLVKKKSQAQMRVHPEAMKDADFIELCRIFRLKQKSSSFDLVSDKIDPFLAEAPKDGLPYLDLETRSLLQVLYFVSQGVEIPPEHAAMGKAPMTFEHDGTPFDSRQVVDGLFRVHSKKSRHRPPCAQVAIQYDGYWYYIDARDRDTKATFSLLVALSRLELASKIGSTPILTIPLGGR